MSVAPLRTFRGGCEYRIWIVATTGVKSEPAAIMAFDSELYPAVLGFGESQLLAYSDLETTLIYTHAIPELQKRAVDKVAEILFPNVPKFPESAGSGKPN
jgi:hypothetical protein